MSIESYENLLRPRWDDYIWETMKIQQLLRFILPASGRLDNPNIIIYIFLCMMIINCLHANYNWLLKLYLITLVCNNRLSVWLLIW